MLKPFAWSSQALFTQEFRSGASRLVSLLLLLLLAAMPLHSQSVTGDVVGTVTDSAGLVVPGAQVAIINTGTQDTRSEATGSAGEYAFNSLQPGSYTLRVEASGFKAYVVSSFTLGAADRTRIPIELQIGTTAQTVSVDAGSLPALQSDSATVQDTVAQESVRDLPLNGRNFVGLVQLTAGVNQGLPNSVAAGGRPDDRRQSSAYSANGQPDNLNNNLIDGLDNNERNSGFIGVRPSIDGISEVHIMTNDYSAEIGRSTGAVVNVLTKSGTDAFHGTLFEFLRNDILDARDAFATTGAKPELRQNDFGGSIGGPIIKGKTFFFADAEWFRQVSGTTSLLPVPTAAQLANPSSLIGGATPDAVGLRYFLLYPAANTTCPDGASCFQSAPNKTQFSKTVDARVDHHFSANDTLFVRYTYNPVTTNVPSPLPAVSPAWAGQTVDPGGSVFNFVGPSTSNSQGVGVDYLHIFNPNLLLELRTGYTGINIDSVPLNYGTNLSNKIGVINGNLEDPTTSALSPVHLLDGSADVGDGVFVPIHNHNNTFQYNGVLTWTRGDQTIKAGGALIRRQVNYDQPTWSPQGMFWTANWAQLLSGGDVFISRGDLSNLQGFRTWEPSTFVQDDWRARNWLTLNIGLRYEVYTPFTEAHNRYSNFDPTSLTVKLASSANPTIGVNTRYADVAPRIGFAATLPHNGVIRGGYGISYYPQDIQGGIQNANPPYSYVCFPCFTTTFPTMPLPPDPSTVSLTNPSGNLNYKPADFHQGLFHQLNLVAQKEIGGNSFSLGYVGSLGRNLLFQPDINRPLPATSAQPAGTPTPARVYAAQLPNVGQIGGELSTAQNNYNSLQASFIRRYRSGLTLNLNYTWAHGLGDSVNPSAAGADGLVTNDPHYDYSDTAADIRHRIAFFANYALPFGSHLHGPAAYAGKGWQLNTIAFWQTGTAFGVSNGVSPQINLPDASTDRPDRYTRYSAIPTSVIAAGNVQCLGGGNSGHCFAPQAFGTAGDTPNFSEYGPHQRRVDLSLFKDFDLLRESKLQFRAEAFNITNTPNLATPSGGFETPGFGTITSTAGNETPRQLQFALKLLF
jgi:hypothetical protein